MLNANQPWLPWLNDEPQTEVLARKTRRRAVPAPPATNHRSDNRAARQAYLGVASSWALSATEALRLLGEPLSNEVERLERLHGVLGAHRSLLLIAPGRGRYAELLRRPDPAFDNVSLLEVMLQQGLPGIVQVRAHLLAQVTR